MRRLSFIMFIILFFSPLSLVRLHAEGKTSVLHIGNHSFRIETPTDWKQVDRVEPCDYKFVHKDGLSEFHIALSCYHSEMDDDDLLDELFEPLEAFYGEDFFESPHYEHVFFNDSEETGSKTLIFNWKKGDVVETVAVFSFLGNDYCSRTLISVSREGTNVEERTVLALEKMKFFMPAIREIR